MARWIVPVLLSLAAAASFCCVHPRARLQARAILAGEDADHHYRLAESRYAGMMPEDARAACRNALALDPSHLAARALQLELDLREHDALDDDYGRYWLSKFGVSREDGIEIVLDRADRALKANQSCAARDDYLAALAWLRESPPSPRKDLQLSRAIAGLKP